jgi:hypothetical protein
MKPELPEIRVSTNSYRQRYLFAFATQAELSNYVRTQALMEEAQKLPQILKSWGALQLRIAALIRDEVGLPEAIRITEVPVEHGARIESIHNDPLFQRTFSALPVQFAVVEIDKMIAGQRGVNLDYVDRLKASYPVKPTFEDLLDICISPTRRMDPIQHLEVAQNVHVFSSPNSDIRFLGAFVKTLQPEDLDFAVLGGIPVAAVISFVGYGGAPVNVLQAGQRVILNNGFHRVYALRSMGITDIPVVVQAVRNPQLEFPPGVAGLPREYLLGHPRPVVMKDFFEQDFGVTLNIRERIKMVTVGVSLSQHEVPH